MLLTYRRTNSSGSGLLSSRSALAGVFLLIAAGLVGCGVGSIAPATTETGSQVAAMGKVHGGQQPVAGSHVYLYAVSQSADAGAATSLLASPGYVVTDAGGAFTITGQYTCPAGSYVYLLALGGNPGLAGVVSNAKLAMAAGLGSCAALTPSTFININEVTTVATAYSLAAFAASETQIGFAATANMTAAFGSISAAVNTASGTALTTTPGGNGIVQQAKIYSLADSIAPCINSDGTGAACSQLMADTGVSFSGSTPVDTFQALLNLAKNPTANVSDLYKLADSNAPFQPTLHSAPADWSLPILFPGPVTLAASPASVSIPQSGLLPVAATATGASGTPFSYRWSTPSAVAQMDDSLHRSSSICSPSSHVLYRPDTGTGLTANAVDSFSATLYTGAGCLPGNAVVTSNAAAVTITPPPSTPYIPGVPSAGYTSAVALPSGSSLTPDQTTVITSVGSAKPLASGTFNIPSYALGPQIAMVLSPNGTPMLLGWLDTTHTVINAETTAEVMAYNVLGGPLMFTPSDRTTTEAAIVNAPGLSQVANTIANEIAQNPDAFRTTNGNVQNALNTFFTGITGITPRTYTQLEKVTPPQLQTRPVRSAVAARPNDDGDSSGTGILVNPGDQSGIEVNLSGNPNAVNTVNTFRRRVHVFLQQVSDIDSSGNEVPDTSNMLDFELSPVNGVNGGVTGAINDIVNYYWGNGTTAYAPVTSDDMPVPIPQGFAKSKYQVTVVGAGAITTTFNALPANIQTSQLQTAVGGFVTDALIPLLSNLYFGSGFENGLSVDAATFEANWRKDITSDILAQLNTLPSLQAKIQTGDYAGALADVIDSIRTSGTFRDIFVDSLMQAGGQYFVSQAGSQFINSIGTVLGGAGGLLQIFDTSVYAGQLAQSDGDDEWTVINGGQKVTFTPDRTDIEQFGQGTVNIVTALPGLDASTGYSYLYTNTANAGTIAPGDGSGSAAATFCSSSATITYAAYTSPLLAKTVSDTISVSAFLGGNCQAANKLGKATITLTVDPDSVSTSPSSVAIAQSQTSNLNAFVPSVNGAYSFQYQLSAASGSPLAATMTDAGGSGQTGSSLCLYSPNLQGTNITISVLPGTDSTSTILNVLNVSAFTGPGCQSANYIGKAPAIAVQIAPHGLLLQPRKSAVPQNESETFSALLEGASSTATYSYMWSFAGVNASLLDKGQANTSPFCTSSAEVTFKPNSTPILTKKVTGSVSVQAFTGSTCDSKAALSATLTTPVTVLPVLMDKPLSLTHAVYGVMQAWDGNFYASSAYNGMAGDLYGQDAYFTNALCTNNAEFGLSNPCGSLYRITPAGVQTSMHDFLPSSANLDQPQLGVYPGVMQQGPDGALYGLTAEGYFFRQSLDGTFSILSALSAASSSVSLNSAPQYILLLGSDGFFYVPGQNGLERFGLDGSHSVTPFNNVGNIAGFISVVEGSDGRFYAVAGDSQNNQIDNKNKLFHFVSFDRAANITEYHTFPLTQYGGTQVGGDFQGSPLIQLSNGKFLFHNTAAFYSLDQGGATMIYSEPYTPTNIFPQVDGASPSATVTDTAGGFYDTSNNGSAVLLEPTAPVGDTMILASDGNIYGAYKGTSLLVDHVTGPNTDNNVFVPVNPNCSFTSQTGQAYPGHHIPVVMQNGCNGLFQLDPTSADAYSNVYNFTGGDDGDTPVNFGTAEYVNDVADGTVIQDAFGNLVGSTYAFHTTKNPAQAGTLFVVNANLPAPIQLSFSNGGQPITESSAGQPVTLQWSVLNAFSLTAQQCYAFVQPQLDGTTSTGAGTWTGKQTGVLSSGTGTNPTTVYSGSLTVTPSAAGTYTYALTCGGRESGFATLIVE